MELSSSLLKSFAAEVNAETEEVSKTAYGTVVESTGKRYVMLDGSSILTAVVEAADCRSGDRVMVTIENHTATVTSNLSNPASAYTASDTENTVNAYYGEFQVLDAFYGNITYLETYSTITEYLSAQYATISELQANYITAGEIDAKYVTIDTLEANYASIETLEANYATIETLKSDYATINDLTAATARITTLEANYADIGTLKANYAEIYELFGDYATIDYLKANYALIDDLTATKADIVGMFAAYATIEDLEANYITASTIKANYAYIDLSNVSVESVGTLFADVGLVTDMTVVNGYITGQLSGVYIDASSIVTGTLDAGTIEVINLNCANLTVGTINGTQIAEGTITIKNLDSEVSGSISEALANAGLAYDEASAAYNLASGKNGVYYQSDIPTGNDFAVNDIWFDTDDDYAPYYWDGASWVSTSFGTDALEKGSIVASKVIAAGSITANEIAANTITAGNIKAGTITSSEIATSTIQSTNIATSAITTDLISANAITADKMYFGSGGNLYSNYDTFEQITDDTIYYAINGGTLEAIISTDMCWYGSQCLKLTGIGGETVYLGSSENNYGCVRVTAGEYYRVSCYAYISDGLSAQLLVMGHDVIDDSVADNLGGEILTSVGSSEWFRIEYTFEAITEYISLALQIGEAGTYYFDAFQIEHVTDTTQVASDFRPSSTTLIDGGNIITESITAEKIAVGSITADRLNVNDIFAQDITATGTITGGSFYGSYIKTTTGMIGCFNIGPASLYTLSDSFADTSNNIYFGEYGLSFGTMLSITYTGIVTSESGLYKSVLDSGWLKFYYDGTQYAYMSAAQHLSSTSAHGLAIMGNSADYIALGYSSTYLYLLNFGANPDGNTEAHQFYSTSRFHGDIYLGTSNIYLCDNVARIDGSTSGKIILYGLTQCSGNGGYGRTLINDPKGQIRCIDSSSTYGFIIRNDGNYVYFLLTDSGSPEDSWNSLRPFYINNSTGAVGIDTATTIKSTLSVTGAVTLSSYLNASGYVKGSYLQGQYIELSGSTPFIDFHYGSSTADYTSRIIESASGTLTVTGGLTVSSRLRGNGGLELYHSTPYIDFHYNDSTADYTSRIIETASGLLNVPYNFSIGGYLTVTGTISEGGTALSSKYAASTHYHQYLYYDGLATVVVGSSSFRAANAVGDNYLYLGLSDYRWIRVYAVNSSISTSDINEKDDIVDIDETYENLFMKLRGVNFKWKNLKSTDNHDRVHCGLIAQEVETACTEVGLNSTTFATLCRDDLEVPTVDGRTERYSLAYGELHGLEIHMIQKNVYRIQSAEDRILELETKVATLEAELASLKAA